MPDVDPRRALPSVDSVLQRERLQQLAQVHGRTAVRRELRTFLNDLRRPGSAPAETPEAALLAIERGLEQRLAAIAQPSLRRVVNATGVVVHTNLGRAPLSASALARVREVAGGYSNLEFDLDSGERGRRDVHVEQRLARVLGAPAGLVVNNCAAAVLLILNTLADGREVLVSRGELVEISGSFRIPDVLAKSGARLREVGTTNRTRLSDYRSALGPQTGLILKVHPSNFRMQGFTETASLDELAGLARETGLPLVEDLGSGYLGGLPELADEPSLPQSLAANVDLVAVSGDKLLGGPQAGLVVGRAAFVAALAQNPLYRALRVDKLTLAALDATLAEHEADRSRKLPVLAMLSTSAEALRDRATVLAEFLRRRHPNLRLALLPETSAVGGGAAPLLPLPTVALALEHPQCSAGQLAARLRHAPTPIVTRISGDRVLLDLRSVPAHDQPLLEAGLLHVLDALAGEPA